MATAIPIARSSDRFVIDALIAIARETEIPEATIGIHGIDGFFDHKAAIEQIEDDSTIKGIVVLDSSVFNRVSLWCKNVQILDVDRQAGAINDLLNVHWRNDQKVLKPLHFAKLVAAAKAKLKAIQVDTEFSTTGGGDFDKHTQARFAELNQLQSIAAQVVTTAHDRSTELDRQYDAKRASLDADVVAAKARGEQELEQLRAKVKEHEADLDARAAKMDTLDSKASRRQLRKDLLDTLKRHSDKFELSATTRRLRMPIAALLIIIVAGSGYLAYLAFFELGAALAIGDMPWWKVALVSLKQLFFAATFLGFAAYALRWYESWSRRHADAEFRFKQLELDIDRASWVVEVALEWREQQGAELPRELLAQMSSGLFSEQTSDLSGRADSEGLLAMILGAGTRLKVSMPGGEVDFDKKGLRQIDKHLNN